MNIEVYTLTGCVWCQECIKLLEEKKLEYTEYSLTQESMLDAFKVLTDRTGIDINFVPVVFADNKLVGAYNGLKMLIEHTKAKL